MIPYVAIALLAVMVAVEVTDILAIPVSLVGRAGWPCWARRWPAPSASCRPAVRVLHHYREAVRLR